RGQGHDAAAARERSRNAASQCVPIHPVKVSHAIGVGVSRCWEQSAGIKPGRNRAGPGCGIFKQALNKVEPLRYALADVAAQAPPTRAVPPRHIAHAYIVCVVKAAGDVQLVGRPAKSVGLWQTVLKKMKT